MKVSVPRIIGHHLVLGVLLATWPAATLADAYPRDRPNPLPVAGPLGPVETCADPTVIAGQNGDEGWFMFCTTDPLGGNDRMPDGSLRFRKIPKFQSPDLIHWTYIGDVLDDAPQSQSPPPGWAGPTALYWAPDVVFLDGSYLLTFAVTDTGNTGGGSFGCSGDSAIGLAVAQSARGPWTVMDRPLVAPRPVLDSDARCAFRWTFDPEVVEAADGKRYLYYGSYAGGIEVRDLLHLSDGRWSAPPKTTVQITIANRYEAAEVVQHDGFFYLFVTAASCCAGPQSGYATFVGRSDNPRGPFRDREGVSLLDQGVGGTPVLVQNGNGWVGPGHVSVIADKAGFWWMFYHAIDEAQPYLAGSPGFTRRPVLMDRLDWVDGWPLVNGGNGPSKGIAAAAAAVFHPDAGWLADDAGGPVISDAFDRTGLDPAWQQHREPAVTLQGGRLSIATTDTDLFEGRNDAPLLLRPLPTGNTVTEVRVRLVPRPEKCCQNNVQGGIVLRRGGGNDAYVKLAIVSIWETLQTEFAREVPKPVPGAPRYGSTVIGPPGEDWTWLKIRVIHEAHGTLLTPFTSRDGVTYVQGGAWRFDLGTNPEIGLFAMGGTGFTAEFKDFAVWRGTDPQPATP